MNDLQLIENWDMFDKFNARNSNAFLLAGASIYCKVCFGIVSLGMIASLTSKVYLIQQQKGPEQSTKYTIFIFACMAVSILGTGTWFTYYTYETKRRSWSITLDDYRKDPKGLPIELQDMLRHVMHIFGMVFGIEYFIVAILVALVFHKFFKLLDNP